MDVKKIGLDIVFIVEILLLQLTRPIVWFYHTPAPSFFGPLFDSDLRKRLQPPDEIIERGGLQFGMTVLDLGCGNGAYTPTAARVVGPTGRVYAVDIQQGMIDQLVRKLAGPEYSELKNVEPKLASAYALPFADESLDLVFMVTVLQEIPDKSRGLQEIRRVLKTGGILAVSESLSDPDYPRRSTTVRQIQKEGFLATGFYGNIWNYTVRFRKLNQS